jgi:hypothetical protein
MGYFPYAKQDITVKSFPYPRRAGDFRKYIGAELEVKPVKLTTLLIP